MNFKHLQYFFHLLGPAYIGRNVNLGLTQIIRFHFKTVYITGTLAYSRVLNVLAHIVIVLITSNTIIYSIMQIVTIYNMYIICPIRFQPLRHLAQLSQFIEPLPGRGFLLNTRFFLIFH